ncbi:MAG: CRP-like cAMP-binding protein [Candidatus Latescibacterota bacterium]
MDSPLAIVQKLALFRDCTPAQVREVLQICVSHPFKEGEIICKAGDKSENMFVILTGSVEIRTAEDVPLLTEDSVTTIGEAGLLTGETRSATVVAKMALTTLSMNRRRLLPLMSHDTELAKRLYRNVLYMVRGKLIASNKRISELLQD